MGNLGHYFPVDERRNHLSRYLVPGSFIYLTCPFTIPPKEKYLLVASIDPKPLLFVVNSNIPPFIDGKPHLKKLQVKILAQDYEFLDHDSYIACEEVINTLDLNEIVTQIDNDYNQIKGNLSQVTKNQVLAAVREATTISQHYKRQIIQALS